MHTNSRTAWRLISALIAPLALAAALSGARAAVPEWQPRNAVEIMVASGPGGGMDRTAAWKTDVENNYCVNNYLPSTDAGRYLDSLYAEFRSALKDLGVVK